MIFISHFVDLLTLFKGFGELDLKELELWKCEALTMDVEINKIVEMKNLTRLGIGGPNISVLPERFGQLHSLVKLDLISCKQLLALPEGIRPCIIIPFAALAIWP